jgi:hypothetical protein
MMDKKDMELAAEEQAELLLRQLMHLKRYETPEVARMTRSRQNIMRQVRTLHGNKRKTIGEWVEASMPWLFAEPKYGIAMLFVAFAGLQYMGFGTRNSAETGIYTSVSSVADLEQAAMISTNSIAYPALPENLRLFPDEHGNGDIKFVESLQRRR